MGTVTKREIVDRIAQQTDLKKSAVKKVLSTFLGLVIQNLGEGHRIEFRDFGVFEPRERKARMAQNPKTLAKVEVPSKRTVKFKPGRMLRERLSGSTEESEDLGIKTKDRASTEISPNSTNDLPLNHKNAEDDLTDNES